jgi:hypothetical protein
MLIVSTPADVHVSAFPGETHATPTRESVTQDAIATQLSTLTTQVKSLAKSMAAVVAYSARSNRGNTGRELIMCTYCDKRGHTKADCFKR